MYSCCKHCHLFSTHLCESATCCQLNGTVFQFLHSLFYSASLFLWVVHQITGSCFMVQCSAHRSAMIISNRCDFMTYYINGRFNHRARCLSIVIPCDTHHQDAEPLPNGILIVQSKQMCLGRQSKMPSLGDLIYLLF